MTDLGRDIQFQLHLLGWKAFQDLCATILREVLGQTFQTYAPGNDGGRDGAFTGTWTKRSRESFEGAFTVQCKHTAKPAGTLTLADLRDELRKAEELAATGNADIYLLLTNHSLTGARAEEIVAALNAVGVRQAACYGAEWISQTILESQRLRMLVPRVYGLGDLSEILDERAYAQAEQLFHAASDELARFVPTEAYRRAAEALESHRFVCLLGEPGSGKSTIGAALALHAADAWGTRCVRTAHPLEFKSHWNPRDHNQLFWVDDALGPLQYQRDFAHLWNNLFPEMAAAIRAGTKIIWTSRDYIFHRAVQDLKLSAFPHLRTAQVVINVGELSLDEKQEMLYNHLKMGDQPKEFRVAAKPHLDLISSSGHLLPEIVRRLALRRFTAAMHPTREQLVAFVERPAEYLAEVIDGLTSDERGALAVLFSRGGSVPAAGAFTPDESALLTTMGATAPNVQQAFRVLEGSFVAINRVPAGAEWTFRHPTMRDAVAELLIRDPVLVRRYVEVTPIQQVMREVTCGDVGLQNVKVVLGRDMYAAIAERVGAAVFTPGRGDRGLREEALSFLSYRCDAEFLKVLREAVPTLVERLPFWSYLNSVSEVPVVVALHEAGLLTDQERRSYVAKAAELAVDTPDAGLITIDGIRAMFASEELDAAMAAVRREVVTRVDDLIWTERLNYSGDSSPDSHFSSLKEAFVAFRGWFSERGDTKSVGTLDAALDDIEEAASELEEDRPPRAAPVHAEYPAVHGGAIHGARSRFDDIDE